MENLTIQAVKDYKTRGGNKAVIYATDRGGEYPIHGCILLTDGTWDVESWSLNGMVHLQNEQHRDIVSEWIEPLSFDWDCLPKWADRWILMGIDGHWYCFDNRPLMADGHWESIYGEGIPIRYEYFPKNFKGDWEESLHENPKYKK